MVIRYVAAGESKWERHAGYALELLLEGIGLACVRTSDVGSADIVYSRQRPPSAPARAVWIPAESAADWDRPLATCSYSGALPLLHPARTVGGDGTCAAGDIVYSSYVAVTGALEQGDERDAWGLPLGEKGSLKQMGLLQTPLVAQYCDHLQSLLRRAGCPCQGVARWPEGKKFAIVVSHDVDFPFSRPTIVFQARRLARDCQRRSWLSAGRRLRSLVKSSALRCLNVIPDLKSDPNLCFERWRKLLSQLQAKSCFYVAVVNSADKGSSPDDVGYSFRQQELVDAMRETIDAGFEIGLHASINSKCTRTGIADEKRLLESTLNGYTLRGVRHHYWAVDAQLPERTLRSHAEAGLQYDSSLGLNDSHGFRRGMCWPFTPFDRDRCETVPILEVPPTMMDGSIFHRQVSAEEGGRQIKQHIDQVAQHGGAVVLDWHLEQLNPARLHGAGPVLERALLELADNTDIYWASPVEMADWWRIRRERIGAAGCR